jgi:hypothetical protein
LLHADERILGESEFVEAVLRAAEEQVKRRTRLERSGWNLDRLMEHIARMCQLTVDELRGPRKARRQGEARSIACYWAVRELGVSATDVARWLQVSQPTVSRGVTRGERAAASRGLHLPVSPESHDSMTVPNCSISQTRRSDCFGPQIA